MAIDPAKLSQSELLQLVNATPLGVVLTRPRLRRQMDAGAFRFGDGTHVHLVRYVRWLVEEVDRPRPAKVDYVEARRRKTQRERAATKSAQDIYPIPEIADYDRRKAAGESFRLFCETYFARAFWRAWSDGRTVALPVQLPPCITSRAWVTRWRQAYEAGGRGPWSASLIRAGQPPGGAPPGSVDGSRHEQWTHFGGMIGA